MTAHQPHEAHSPSQQQHNIVIQWLERMDNWAHVVVAAFFILMASTVIVHMGFIFLRQLPLIVPVSAPVSFPAVASNSREAASDQPAPAGKTEGASEET